MSDQSPAPVIEVRDLAVHFDASRTGLFQRRRQKVYAIDGVSFTIAPGETLGLVGESGSGKTTTGRAILRRLPVTAGSIAFKGEDITHLEGEPLRRLRRHMQLVYQDPYASLNPRMRVREIIAEPLVVHGVATAARPARGATSCSPSPGFLPTQPTASHTRSPAANASESASPVLSRCSPS